MGESYGGVSAITLGLLLDADKSVNLKGIAIGNGLLDEEKSYLSLLLLGYHYGLYGKTKLDLLSRICCGGQPPSVETCRFETNLGPCDNLITGLVNIILYSGVIPTMFTRIAFGSQPRSATRTSRPRVGFCQGNVLCTGRQPSRRHPSVWMTGR